MLTYTFSIFVRGYLALSGLAVFFVTASLFGATGRGLIGYGTSIFAALGIFLSLNLGRVYLSALVSETENKERLLFHCLSLNVMASLITMIAGLTYWSLSSSAQEILTRNQILGFSLSSFFYVWMHNGHIFYSSFLKTKIQDFIIFITRSLILLFLAVLIFFFRSLDISFFIWTYSSILLFGTLTEMYVIKHMTKTKVDLSGGLKNYFQVMRNVFWPHLDYILFNVFPLLLMVLSASHLRIEEMGRVNFSIQMINLIFLFSTTAHMRVNAYVANGGIQGKFDKFWKLLAITSLASMVGSALVYGATHFLPQVELFSSFTGVSQLFLISLIALPGFILFQFFNPIWIEMRKLKTTVSLQMLNFVICLALSPSILDHYGPRGFLWIFSLFYFNNIPIHLWLYWRAFVKSTKPFANESVSLNEFSPR